MRRISSRLRLSPAQALNLLTSKEGLGVFASADTLFRDAVFGRDSLEVAEDLLFIKPRLVEAILLSMASLQGEADNRVSEEEPGKIIHEYRRAHINGRPLDGHSQAIFEHLAGIWSDDKSELAYYGSIDSTPLFIKVLCNHCHIYGKEILQKQVTARSGKHVLVLDTLQNAVGWLVKHLEESKSGFLEFQRQNPQGLENQAWKDSREFYVHQNGRPANHSRPIASIEVQGLAYDALVLASELLPSQKPLLQKYAAAIQRNLLKYLWLGEINYFALGTDYSQQGALRIIKTVTANPAGILNSSIFDGLPARESQKYLSGIVERITGPDFLTDAGIRSRALSEAGLIKYWDYHGSFVAWPKETYDIAKGLRRQGFNKLAQELENRILDLIKATRCYPEFVFVDAHGRILGLPASAQAHGHVVFVKSKVKPQKIQAWTVSAAMAIKKGKKHSEEKSNQRGWQKELEDEILQKIPHVPRLRTVKEISSRYPVLPYEVRGQK